MPNRPTLVICSAIALCISAGCASGSATGATTSAATTPGSPGLPDPNFLSASEIMTAATESNSYDLLQRLRPKWITDRGVTSFRGTGATLVSLDGGQLTTLDVLQQIQVVNLKEMRLLSATDAAQRFGTKTGGSKVIVVTRK